MIVGKGINVAVPVLDIGNVLVISFNGTIVLDVGCDPLGNCEPVCDAPGPGYGFTPPAVAVRVAEPG